MQSLVEIYLDSEAIKRGKNTVKHEVKTWLKSLKHRDPGVTPTKRTQNAPKEWVDHAFHLQGFECFYQCGQTNRKMMTGDHLIPLAKGGKHVKLNIVAACKNCNSEKGTMNVIDFAKRKGITIKFPKTFKFEEAT